MKKIIVILVLLASSFTFGQKVNGLIQVEGFSGFPWRQLLFHQGTGAYGEISYQGFSAAFFQYTNWKNKNINQLTNDELDLLLGYNFTVEKTNITLLYTYYNLPSVPDGWSYSHEIGLILEPKFILSPVIEYYYDFDEFERGYYGITLNYTVPLEINLALTGAINDGQWTENMKTVSGITFKAEREFDLNIFKLSLAGFAIINKHDNHEGFVIKISKTF